MTNEETGSPTLAQMIHQTHLMTWLARTVGRALAILVAIPVFGALLTTATGDPGWLVLGSALGVIIVILWLTGVQAPFPTDDVVALLDTDES